LSAELSLLVLAFWGFSHFDCLGDVLPHSPFCGIFHLLFPSPANSFLPGRAWATICVFKGSVQLSIGQITPMYPPETAFPPPLLSPSGYFFLIVTDTQDMLTPTVPKAIFLWATSLCHAACFVPQVNLSPKKLSFSLRKMVYPERALLFVPSRSPNLPPPLFSQFLFCPRVF